jgi:hypothetical protein
VRQRIYTHLYIYIYIYIGVAQVYNPIRSNNVSSTNPKQQQQGNTLKTIPLTHTSVSVSSRLFGNVFAKSFGSITCLGVQFGRRRQPRKWDNTCELAWWWNTLLNDFHNSNTRLCMCACWDRHCTKPIYDQNTRVLWNTDTLTDIRTHHRHIFHYIRYVMTPYRNTNNNTDENWSVLKY